MSVKLTIAVVAPDEPDDVVIEAFAQRYEDALNELRGISPVDRGVYIGSWSLDRVDVHGVTISNRASDASGTYAAWVRRKGASQTLIPEIYRKARRAAALVMSDLADELPAALLGELHRQTEK